MSVAFRAADAAVDVNAVVEEDEVGDEIDAIPSQRRIGGEALPDGREDGGLGIKL